MSETIQNLDDVILAPVEHVMDSIGLMQGSLAPLKRTMVGLGIGYGFATFVQPSFAYLPDGTPRPWILTAAAGDKTATYFPSWMVIGAPAVILGLMI